MRSFAPALMLLVGCAPSPPDEPGVIAAVVDPVSVVTYNLANGLGGTDSGALVDHLADIAGDFIAVQEANADGVSGDWLPADHELVAPPTSGVALAYDATRWRVDDSGTITLGVDDDGWGPRVAQWARFADEENRGITVYSTHWCVTIRSAGDACDEQRQLEYAGHILDSMDNGLPAVVAGDLNVFDGFESGSVMRYLSAMGLLDAVCDRSAEDCGEATFLGNDWAPPGRIDYILATAPVTVVEASIIQPTAGPPPSDHLAVSAIIGF